MKLTEQLTVKLTADDSAAFHALASTAGTAGTDASHLMRDLIKAHIEKAHSHFISLSRVFGNENKENEVGR